MATAYSVLGQSNPSATTATTLYTVGASLYAVVSTLVICNQGTSAGSFRVAVRPAGAGLSALHYLYYDLPLDANDTFAATFGITLEATDVVTVYASSANFSFSLFGSEIDV